MRKSAREKIREAKRGDQSRMELSSLDDFLKLLVDGSRTPDQRRLNPTQREFIYDATRLKAYMGPAGCAKTSTICAAGLARALFQPGSKGLVARYDYNDLMDTTKLRLEEMIASLPKGTLVDRDKSAPEKWWIQPVAMPDPETGELKDDLSQITFMGLKEAMGSYEFNWAIIDEADEVEEKRVHEVGTRLRHRGGGYAVMLAFNPPDKHHWLYTACTGRDFQDRKIREPWLKHFLPRPDENIRNLPVGYYDELAKDLPEDMKQRLIEGQWGSTFEGQPVYREFKFGVHVKDDLHWDGVSPMLRFWDFGYNRPCCIWAYVDYEGRLLILHSELGSQVEATQWVAKCKAISAERFPAAKNWIDFGDPAAVQKKDTGSTLAVLHKAGIQLRFRTSTIDYGLRLTRARFNSLINGEPAIQFDRRGNTILIAALRGGYRMSDDGQKPKKDGYYDHLADALRYGVINLFVGADDHTAGVGVQHGGLPDNVEYSEEQDHGS